MTTTQLQEQRALSRRFWDAFFYDGYNRVGQGYGVLYLITGDRYVNYFKLPPNVRAEVEENLRGGVRWIIPDMHPEAVLCLRSI